MPDLLVRVAKPGQQDHYVPEQRARALEDDGWTVVTEESLTAPEQLAELALRVLELQVRVDELAGQVAAVAAPPPGM